MGTPQISKSNLVKALQALTSCLCQPRRTLQRLRRGLALIYQEQMARQSPLPRVTLDELVGRDTVLKLADFGGRAGNVTLYELLVISAIVSRRQPRVLLEIGTFDGNTTLQMAHNSPADARVYTLDLPPDKKAQAALDPQDATYIGDRQKLQRKYAGSPVGHKVIQCLGDSATFDFHSILEHGRPQLAFIDGSHSYDYVRNDTEKVLEILAPGGVVLWHDYVPGWPGVMEYLGELHTSMPLRRIDGTALVYLDTARLATGRKPQESPQASAPDPVPVVPAPTSASR
ncbi:MAG: class I SAM-dependent methyltransferase [Planctomycetota bacterium]|jgi:predicted O-methyltransferase YrrM